ncbi:MAG: hypothetical protein V4586_07640 [Pseudomonadota bacterium]
MWLHDPSKAAQDVQMTQTMSQRPSRRATYVAFAVFALAYIGVMVVIFAPEGSLSSRNPLLATQQTE